MAADPIPLLSSALVALLTVIGLWALARHMHLARLRTIARRPIRIPPDESVGPMTTDWPNGAHAWSSESFHSLADAGWLSMTTGAAFVWQWASLDPDIIEIIDSVSKESIDSTWSFIEHIAAPYAEASGQQQFLSRLVGHVGEYEAGERLIAASHHVIRAPSPENPAWDYIVDGTYVDVKTLAHTRNADFGRDDVTYLIAEDTAGSYPDNVEVLEGLIHADIKERVAEALGQGTGDAAAEGLSAIGLPGVTVLLIVRREFRAFRAGKEPIAAVEHAASESVIKGAAVVAGAAAGREFGEAIYGPVGGAVGTVVGAGAGAVTSMPVASYVKGRRVRAANRGLKSALAEYGNRHLDKLDDLTELARRPLDQMDATLARLDRREEEIRKSWRWRIWPTLPDVTLSEATVLGRQRRAAVADRTSNTLKVLRDAPKDPAKFAAALLAVPDVLDRLDHQDAARRLRIGRLADRVTTERRNLEGSNTKRRPSDGEADADDD